MDILTAAAAQFFSSVIGAVLGIGGGVIIKPVLDMIGIMSVKQASFISGITVLCMSTYSVIKNAVSKTQKLDMNVAVSISLGSAFGGVIGKSAFNFITSLLKNTDEIGSVQAASLFILTAFTFIYTLKKDNIKKSELRNIGVTFSAGIFLGVVSSFLGIGGGPINIMVLSYLFSFDSKECAIYSLFIIMVSQIASLILQTVTKTIPEFSLPMLIIMAFCAVCGGIIGRKINSVCDNKKIDVLFLIMMAVIMGICIFNFFKY